MVFPLVFLLEVIAEVMITGVAASWRRPFSLKISLLVQFAAIACLCLILVTFTAVVNAGGVVANVFEKSAVVVDESLLLVSSLTIEDPQAISLQGFSFVLHLLFGLISTH